MKRFLHGNAFFRFLAFLISPIETFRSAKNGYSLDNDGKASLIAPYELLSPWTKILYIPPAVALGVFSIWGVFGLVGFFLYHHLLTSILLAVFPWTQWQQEQDNCAYIAGEFKRDLDYKLLFFLIPNTLCTLIVRCFF